MSASLVGQKLGKYEITDLIGQGGMATVYKGYQRDVERFVAVKVLPPHPGRSSQFVERFRLEARTIARLQHPHILPLYDYGDDDEVLYLVMAYVDGGSLSDLIRREPLSLAEAGRRFEQVAGALDYAHRQNVIHRDIKPDNILLDREGHALLADFGIAKMVQDVGGSTLTGTGGLVGTPAYMSPEQAQGLPVDNRTDIYSLGVVVYEMLTGKQPFEAETPMQVVFQHITAPIPSLSQLSGAFPPELDQVMARALAKDPAQRYPSARRFYEDFSRVTRGDAPLPAAKVNTPPPPLPLPNTPPQVPAGTWQAPPPTVVAHSGWNPLVLLGGFAIIALLIVAVVALLLNFNRPDSAETPSPPTPTAGAVAVVVSPVASVPNFGSVAYSTDKALGDTVDVQVRGLTPPPSGSSYRVWLYNTANERALKLGSLRLDALGNGQLSYTGAEVLPIAYNAVLVTQEDGDSETPAGKVAYSGAVPIDLMRALRDILISSSDGIPEAAPQEAQDAEYATTPSPAGSSLLAGALEEASIAARHSGLAAQATSAGSLHTHAEHTINILNGTTVDYNNNGRGENPGRGYGIAYFTDRIQAKLNAAGNVPEANRLIQSQAELIRVCIVNAGNWMKQVINLETQMLTAEDLEAVHAQLVEATELAAAIISGVDLNRNGEVEPFEGECGLQQIESFGISVGNITILSGPLS